MIGCNFNKSKGYYLASFLNISVCLQHDVITTYSVSASMESPVNVHLRCVEIAPALHLVGAGGSVPGYRNGAQCWDSFPYPSDEAFAADLTKILDPVFMEEGALSHTDAVILMTHNGPDQSSESIPMATPNMLTCPNCRYYCSQSRPSQPGPLWQYCALQGTM